MNLAQPVWLALFGLVLGLYVVVSWYVRRRQAAWRQAFSEHQMLQMVPPAVHQRRRLQWLAMVGSLLCVVFALTEPRYDRQTSTVDADGVDLVVALDLSLSMLAEDVSPNRLRRAKREVDDLLKELAGDEVGLVLFAGGAVPRLPLTADHKMVSEVLRSAEPSDFTAQGSAFAPALKAARELLTRDVESMAGKAIVIITDGEAHDSDEVQEEVQHLIDEGIAVYGLGVGEEASTIPINGKPFQYKGETVITSPNFELLEQIATQTNGGFHRSQPSAADVQWIVHSEIRKKLRAVQRSQRQHDQWRALFQWPIGLAFLLSFFAFTTFDGRSRRSR